MGELKPPDVRLIRKKSFTSQEIFDESILSDDSVSNLAPSYQEIPDDIKKEIVQRNLSNLKII
jgi:hypothetical protein